MPSVLPSLFLSHGSPMLVLSDIPARHFLAGLGGSIGRPQATLVVSAHWEAPRPTFTTAARNATIHDFYGFPPPLYQLQYPAPGSGDLARSAAALLAEAGLVPGFDETRGLDHGAWAPLLLAFPAADIPVVQLSLVHGADAAEHYRMGRALAPLREEGVLVLGSGSFTHNLGELAPDGSDEPPWVDAFASWVDRCLVEGRIDDLVAWQRLAPEARRAHPTAEHFLPLFVALGVAGAAPVVERLHASATHGSLRMDAYAFRGAVP